MTTRKQALHFRDGITPVPRRSPISLIRRFLKMAEKKRQRQDLLELDDRQLKDIGVSRDDAKKEGGKPFWK